MAKEIYPSSFECDCGHQSDFFAGTIEQMKRMGQEKKIRLGDCAANEHVIVFHKGRAIEIICPRLGKRPI